MAKKTEIPKLADDAAVKIAQQKLLDVQARFERAANYPLADDIASRAKALLDGVKLQPRKEPDLALVVERWPDLPEHIKAAIKALVETHIKGDKK